jgi:hypothetical protein
MYFLQKKTGVGVSMPLRGFNAFHPFLAKVENFKLAA